MEDPPAVQLMRGASTRPAARAGAALFVLLGLIAIGTSPVIAILLAGIAVASAPAATVDVIREIDAKGRTTETVLGVVAIDDVTIANELQRIFRQAVEAAAQNESGVSGQSEGEADAVALAAGTGAPIERGVKPTVGRQRHRETRHPWRLLRRRRRSRCPNCARR